MSGQDELDLPPWLSYVTYTDEAGTQTGIAQLPLTYDGPSIPLEYPWTSPGGNGGLRISLLGGTGFQTLAPTTITAVISTTGGTTDATSDSPTDNAQDQASVGQQTTVPLLTTDSAGLTTTIPGVVTTQPNGQETTVAAAAPLRTATIYATGTATDGTPITTGLIPGLVSTLPGGSLTTIPATASLLPNGDTTVVPINPQPATTTATLQGTSLTTTATGYISTRPDGDTTTVFPSLSSLLSELSAASASASTASENQNSASHSESSGPIAPKGSGLDLSAGQIAGLVVGSILALLIILALLVILGIRRKRQRRQQHFDSYARFANAAPGSLHRHSDPAEDSEADIDVDPSQLFMQPPAGYTGVGALPSSMREVPSGSTLANDSRRSLGLVPSSRFSNRLLNTGAPLARPGTQGSYQTVSTSDTESMLSTSHQGSPPLDGSAAQEQHPVTAAYDPSYRDNNSSSYNSSNTTNPFRFFNDSFTSQGSSLATTPPSAPAHLKETSKNPLPTIPASPEDSLKESPTESATKIMPQAWSPAKLNKLSIPNGMTGLGLGMFFGLVGQGRRAISLNGTDDFEDRESKESTTPSDPIPIRQQREPIFPTEASPRHRQPSTAATSDDEADESASLLDEVSREEDGDPLLTRWSRTTFGKKFGTSSHEGSDTQSMVASILSKRSNQAIGASSLKRAKSDGRRVVSEGSSSSLGPRTGSRRTQNSSDGTHSSLSGSSHSGSWKRRRKQPDLPHRQPITTRRSVLETAEEEEGPSIRLVSRSQTSFNKQD